MDFYTPLSAKDHAVLVRKISAAAKPTNQMSNVEWAEYQVLDAALKLEGLKAALLYTKVTTGHLTLNKQKSKP